MARIRTRARKAINDEREATPFSYVVLVLLVVASIRQGGRLIQPISNSLQLQTADLVDIGWWSLLSGKESNKTRHREFLQPLILPGNHVNIPPPESRIGPNGEVAYVHNPKFALENPRPLQLTESICLPPGQGFEQPDGYRNLQKIRNHLHTSTSPRNVTVFCAVYTYVGNTNNTEAVRETWGQRCDGLLFASNESNRTSGHMHLPSNSQHGFQYQGMHQRVRTIMAYLYDNFLNSGYDYFHFCGDDTYLIIEHLKEFLASDRVQQWETVPGRYTIAGFWSHWGSMKQGTIYFAGASGYTLSRKTIKAYVEGPMRSCSQNYVDHASEDMSFAACFEEVLPQRETWLDTRDEANAHRYHLMNVNWHSTKEFPNYDGGFRGKVMKGAMLHMQQRYGFPIVSKDAYISNSSIAFHRHAADALRRYDILLYRDSETMCNGKV